MWRLTDRMVRSTLVTAWRLATSPTSTSPFLAKATTDGVVREPSALAMTVGSPPSRTETTELVVPRSIPTARAMVLSSAGKVEWVPSCSVTIQQLLSNNLSPSAQLPSPSNPARVIMQFLRSVAARNCMITGIGEESLA